MDFEREFQQKWRSAINQAASMASSDSARPFPAAPAPELRQELLNKGRNLLGEVYQERDYTAFAGRSSEF
ncbi:MAG: hypothetical protein U5L96_10930 [Owenweeksia sp.]|nr:hypothetical protein [Owenweeksia sp.]